jgi:hypothetical protein
MALRITFFLSALCILALVHVMALQFYIYWQYLWFDIPMHILGGVCVALGVSILPFLRIHFFEKHQNISTYLAIVLCVGVVWEIFEYGAGISIILSLADFIIDTILDLCMDLFGGIIGYAFVMRLNTI